MSDIYKYHKYTLPSGATARQLAKEKKNKLTKRATAG